MLDTVCLHGDEPQDLVGMETSCCPRQQIQCLPHGCCHGENIYNARVSMEILNIF